MPARRRPPSQPGALFAAGEVVVSGRVRLSRLDVAELEPLAGWLAAALAPDWTLDDLIAHAEAGRGVRIADAEAAAIGVAVVLLDQPSAGAATVPFLSIDPARRYRGLGGEAALALERHLRARHAIERVYAPVPDGRGLPVYFWLRAGYRPLLQSQSPGALIGLTDAPVRGIWMLRDEA